MVENSATKKVAILGGGMGALTAAYELSEQGGYDITVYQLGWRLGGQGASGRNLNLADRIEEHGLHVWFGFYENAFSLMRRCYTELGRPASAPLASVEQAFRPVNSLTMIEKYKDQRLPWTVGFPTDESTPGSGGEISTLWSSLILLLKWMIEFAEQKPIDSSGSPQDKAPNEGQNIFFRIFKRLLMWLNRIFRPGAPMNSTHDDLPEWVEEALNKAEAAIQHEIHDAEIWLLKQALHFATSLPADHKQHSHMDHSALAWLIREFVTLMWKRVKATIETDTDARRLWTLLYLGATSVAGMLNDRVLFDGFDPLDRHDMIDWFYAHKLVDDQLANDIAYHSAPTQTVYDLLFHYKGGDTNRPQLSAGVALRMLIKMLFQYKGSVLWFMQAAMGDTIFAPMYQVLSNRGVKFEFFNRVVNLGLSADNKSIQTVRISRQINLKVGQYNPLVLIKDLPCWPSEPLYDQIVEGEQLRREHIDLEHAHTTWKDTGGEVTLQAGQDFDSVVLGIGIGALPPLTQELKGASDSWSRMIEKIETVQTQAIQLWMKPDSKQLGVHGSRPVIGAYVEPYSSLTDFSDLIPRENWPVGADLQSIIYSCGVLQEIQDETQAEADRRVHKIALEFLEHDANPLWPKATRPSDPEELAWHDLVAPDDVKGKARFDTQYWRANIDPVERYVLSLPDTNQYRIKADNSGFEHLILAGNWIDTGFNIACIETAVMSGMQAARAITGKPEYIAGEDML